MKVASQGQAQFMPVTATSRRGPEGALIPDADAVTDTIAVVYDKGQTPPVITISDASSQVRTVMANGVAVAIVACASGPRLTKQDVLLVQRFVTNPE